MRETRFPNRINGLNWQGSDNHWGYPPHLHLEFKTKPVLSNPSPKPDVYWGYIPKYESYPHPISWGYLNPHDYIDKVSPMECKDWPIEPSTTPTSSNITPTIIPSNTPVYQTLISGKWKWEQTSGPYWGYFYITQSGNTFSGTLDDVWEGTYGDKVIDGIINGSSFSFTRDGRYGIQYWYGTIDINNGVMEINNGLWQKQGWVSDNWLPFHAEFISPNY
jgi:hypothetical protein